MNDTNTIRYDSTVQRLQEEILAFEARQTVLLEKNGELAGLLGKLCSDWSYAVQQVGFATETVKAEIKRWKKESLGEQDYHANRCIEELQAALHCLEEAVCSR